MCVTGVITGHSLSRRSLKMMKMMMMMSVSVFEVVRRYADYAAAADLRGRGLRN